MAKNLENQISLRKLCLDFEGLEFEIPLPDSWTGMWAFAADFNFNRRLLSFEGSIQMRMKSCRSSLALVG
jgi:hypothetical protein